VVVGAVGFLGACGGGNGEDAFRFEKVSSATPDPFTDPVGEDKPVDTPKETGGPTDGNKPGLYGGSGDRARCDREMLAGFLEANPAKKAAWAEVLRISPSDVRRYIAGLTPLVLRKPTAVTNHGYKDSRATVVPAILQEGVAVLVDQYGAPVVKCNCGNPLTKPSSRSAPSSDAGKAWSGYSPDKVVFVESSVTIINVFTVINLDTDQDVQIPVPPVPPVPTLPPTTETTTETPPAEPTETYESPTSEPSESATPGSSESSGSPAGPSVDSSSPAEQPG
jgi:hypothetical protein